MKTLSTKSNLGKITRHQCLILKINTEVLNIDTMTASTLMSTRGRDDILIHQKGLHLLSMS